MLRLLLRLTMPCVDSVFRAKWLGRPRRLTRRLRHPKMQPTRWMRQRGRADKSATRLHGRGRRRNGERELERETEVSQERKRKRKRARAREREREIERERGREAVARTMFRLCDISCLSPCGCLEAAQSVAAVAAGRNVVRMACARACCSTRLFSRDAKKMESHAACSWASLPHRHKSRYS